MNETLTLEIIAAAQAKDIPATAAVLEATESRIATLAEKAARRMAPSGDRLADYRDEFMQVGRIAVWESLSRFAGDSVDVFYGFIYSTVENTLLDSVRDERNPASGADKDAMQVFGNMLERADGDVYLAERFAQTVPPKGRRLSADRAQAARMAWQGTLSIDAPDIELLNSESGEIFAKTLNESLATSLGVPEDLVTAADLTAEDKRVKHAIVNGILDVMGAAQRDVIRHSFGIGGAAFYGRGDSGNDEGLGELLGSTAKKVRDAREKGMKSFAKRYIVATASSEEEAKELTEEAAKNLAPGGRK